MNEPLLIILIIAVVFIFGRLNSKIKRLENEVSQLNKRINSSLDQPKIIQNQNQQADHTSIAEQNNTLKTSIPKETPVTNDSPVLPQEKDWIAPVMDFLKQNALTVIGIFTLVLGIGYFVKYAIDNNWIGETARAGIGLCTGVGILLTGYFLRKNYSVFSSIITGGGIAVLYFTTTIAFREYHLFTQNTAFAVITFITIISILLPYYYKSEILIIFSLIGGFSAPLMISTGQSNYHFLFTYLTLLNIGMLVVVFLKHWRSIGWVSFLFTTLYILYWTYNQSQLLSIVFYSINYIIFYVFALQEYLRKKTMSPSDILMLVLINFSSIIGMVYIFNKLNYESSAIFPIIFALVNGALLFREHAQKNIGIAYSVFAGITISLVTIAAALLFKVHLITSVWAVEATLLLFIWKKTNLKIFKTCFSVLFPLVIIAQIMTWLQYINANQLSVVFNPIFLTSLVTVISMVVNLFLLKKIHETQKQGFFPETIFSTISYAVIYTAMLLEIIYHISGMQGSVIISIGVLFSIYYIFILLLLKEQLSLNSSFQNGLIYLLLLLVAVHVSFSASEISTSILSHRIPFSFYWIHLLYWMPFLYLYAVTPRYSDFYTAKTSYWIISFVFVLSVSSTFYHLYMLTMANDIPSSYKASRHFNILYLPILWTVIATVFIYIGLQKKNPEYNKIGFALIGIMAVKLYAYDVWQMDNISRIIAFIILGVILLLSSFMFQRLKNIITNLVDKKEIQDENMQS
ncbi:beta-carotene 15,15'-monooxygenase [Chryseobacterium soli]|uniref:Beta-carotene 15,15'-monooxygenase n=1 Tax=Chryseobacterium soli TaxID=445961 RepID=A0A086ADK0_9FLAO|nr:DUF2339 domain-containing protein [Chryseobacterium soli]KFF14764.1 beta-carotene 15,15'-monooxygenase [Chryseobacterium soli]